jgi:hypothetical protein
LANYWRDVWVIKPRICRFDLVDQIQLESSFRASEIEPSLQAATSAFMTFSPQHTTFVLAARRRPFFDPNTRNGNTIETCKSNPRAKRQNGLPKSTNSPSVRILRLDPTGRFP